MGQMNHVKGRLDVFNSNVLNVFLYQGLLLGIGDLSIAWHDRKCWALNACEEVFGIG